ncbi:MAG: hypothetical protein GY906_10130 [bacterium]|nr:hypothetical protein [bacterium]
MPEQLLELLGRITTQLADDSGEEQEEVRYRTLLAPEDMMTSDRRYIEPDALTWRDSPIHVMWSDTEVGHGDAVLVGTFTDLHKEDVAGTTWVVADDIDWDLHEDNESAPRAKRLVDEGRLTGVSIHMADMDADVECEETENDDGDTEVECQLNVHAGTIAAATIVAIPAFEDAVIEPVAAAADADLYAPPREWFNDPELTGPTPLTVDDDGRLFGHLALWDSCHIGFEGICVSPPKDQTEYAEFHAHANITTEDGALIPVGVITVDGSHASTDPSVSVRQAIRHYTDTATVGGYVRAGNDEFGPWVAGALAPDLPEATIEKLRRLPLSGDWRPQNGQHVLIAALAVPVPGFSIKARVAAGVQTALITMGLTPTEEPETDLALVASALNAVVDRLTGIEYKLTEDERAAELAEAFSVFQE